MAPKKKASVVLLVLNSLCPLPTQVPLKRKSSLEVQKSSIVKLVIRPFLNPSCEPCLFKFNEISFSYQPGHARLHDVPVKGLHMFVYGSYKDHPAERITSIPRKSTESVLIFLCGIFSLLKLVRKYCPILKRYF